MKRLFFPALLSALLAASASHAQDAGFCQSMCASERKECRAQAAEKAGYDSAPPLQIEDSNPHAQAAARRAGQPAEVRAAEKSSFQRALEERGARCDTRFRQCTRGCGPAAAPSRTKS
jgi:hypothetical protein